MEIRESAENDIGAIRKVHENAFAEAEGKTVSQLAIDIIKDITATRVLSLVAETDNEIVGNIIFSAVKIEGSKDISAYILAPLAVTKKLQGRGIGTQLINQGLKALKDLGAGIVLVLGDPNYYSRTGFRSGHNLRPPYDLEHPQAWMAQELIDGALAKAQGKVQCAASLNSPEHW
ncbi:MAG: N-acetyltransferase [Arenicellales bacterium]